MEAVFAQARDAEAASEEFLVDDGWKVVEVEPEVVEVNGNGHHANGVGPSFELVPVGNGHAAVPVNGNGRHDEAPEPQQSLFSWAEFMAEEPVKPKGRRRKPQPSSPSLFEIPARSPTAHLTLRTMNDANDEADGTVEAEVLSDTGYTVGTSSPVSVTVLDDDVPLAPTGLRANGHLANGEVTLRWDPVPEATSYNVRYVEEICDLSGVCAPDGGAANPNWQTRTGIPTSGNAVKEATLGGLTEKKLYRVEVQAVVVDPSAWSGFALVYPTDGVLTTMVRVATIELVSYQGTLVSFQVTGEFDYDICNPPTSDDSMDSPQPDPLPIIDTASDTVSMIQDAIGMWENTAKWHDDAVGANIVQATGHEVKTCTYPEDQAFSLGHRHQVAFYNDDKTNLLCQDREAFACWTLKIDTIDLIQADPRSIVMRSSEDWSVMNAGGCTKLHATLIHESGHSFGFGHAVTEDSSIMFGSYNSATWNLCEPTAYDIAAMMANYQSR